MTLRKFVPRPAKVLTVAPSPRPTARGSGLLALAMSMAAAPESVPSTTTDAERDYMGRVAALGCVACRLLGFGPTPCHVHHVRTGQGAQQRAGNYLVLGLCEPHHTGPHGVHGDKGVLRQLGMTEMDLLDWTIGALARGMDAEAAQA